MAEQATNLQAYVDAPLLQLPDKPLVGKSALVTGATRMNGIGLAITERLAFEGARVVIMGTPASQDIAPFAVTRLRRYGAQAHSLVGDITDKQSCMDIMKRSYELCDGNVDFLVNNAGTNRHQIFTDINEREDDWEYVMAKAKGAVFMTQGWFKIRNEANIRGGKVVNIGSIIGSYGMGGNDLYAMANSSLWGFTQTRARAFGERGITVNLIELGFVPGTEMTGDLPPEVIASARAFSSLNLLVRQQDAAGAVAYLLSPDGDRVTGTRLTIDCGLQSAYTAVAGLRRTAFRLVSSSERKSADG